jgi:hypothetical protein
VFAAQGVAPGRTFNVLATLLPGLAGSGTFSASEYTQQVIAQTRRIGPSSVQDTSQRIGSASVQGTRRRIGKAPA